MLEVTEGADGRMHEAHIRFSSVQRVEQGGLFDEPAARQDADTFLREFLAAGPVASRDIFRAGQANGISRRTLFRAKRRLGIPAHRTGFGAEGGWTWELPAMPA